MRHVWLRAPTANHRVPLQSLATVNTARPNSEAMKPAQTPGTFTPAAADQGLYGPHSNRFSTVITDLCQLRPSHTRGGQGSIPLDTPPNRTSTDRTL